MITRKLFLTISTSIFALPVMAQDVFLDDIIVTAGEEKVAIDTPQSVSVVDEEDLADPSVQSVGDGIGDLPGVTVIGGGSPLGQSFNIRGIGSVASGDESRFIMNIDGTTKYFEQYRMGSLFADPAMFKSVEVLRGPASSTLFGAGALAGVVSMETVDPEDFLENGATTGGSYELGFDTDLGGGNRYNASATYAWQVSPKTAFLASLSYKHGDDYTSGEGVTLGGTKYLSYTALGKGVYKFGSGDSHSIEASWMRYFSDQKNISFSQTGFLGGAFGFIDRTVYDDTINLTYKYQPEENDLIDLRVTLAYSDILNEQRNVTAFGPMLPGSAWDTAYENYQLTVENTADVSGGRWENYITAGVAVSQKNRISLPAVSFQPEGTTNTIGIYAQGEFTYDGKLTLIPGIRVDAVEQVAGSTSAFAGSKADYTLISPKLAALYKFNDTFSIFGSIAHTENAPVVDMLFDSSSGNLNLTKEQSDNVEVGFTLEGYDILQNNDAAKLKVTAFRNQVYDMVDRVGLGQFNNNTDAEFVGLEVEAAYDSELYFATLTYSMVDGRIVGGGEPRSIPADEMIIKLGTRIPSYDLSVGWQTRLTAEQPAGPTPGYVLHDIFATYAPETGALEGWEIRGEVSNIFDTAYITHLNRIAGGDKARGTSFSISLGRKF